MAAYASARTAPLRTRTEGTTARFVACRWHEQRLRRNGDELRQLYYKYMIGFCTCLHLQTRPIARSYMWTHWTEMNGACGTVVLGRVARLATRVWRERPVHVRALCRDVRFECRHPRARWRTRRAGAYHDRLNANPHHRSRPQSASTARPIANLPGMSQKSPVTAAELLRYCAVSTPADVDARHPDPQSRHFPQPARARTLRPRRETTVTRADSEARLLPRHT